MSEYRHITQLLTNQFEKRLLICIIWKIYLFRSIVLFQLTDSSINISWDVILVKYLANVLQHTLRDEWNFPRCEVLDQLESTQQNRSQPGQIKAQLIILIDKRRLHAWRQISLRKIDEQFLMYVLSHFL
ncbi:hypothetical protein T02_3981 [Trichinella nativa]|uniref:Uncharacterized protein n=1 Tax=Trichinella nativa TaxID=6335 RepID=A0A0V1LKY1_9BILA|nr:hypothetical protein T02_3981 [Trichinella nativa]